ncbi:hypothetical protein GQ53DRAFT_633272, partial [Thozetella sp. PMI_491]
QQDLAPNLAGTVLTLGILAFLTHGLRVYTRVSRQCWGMEDWVMTVGTVPLFVLTVATTIGAFNGLGIRDRTFAIPGNEGYYKTGMFWFFIYEVFYCTSIIPIKLSIAFMLNRIAGNRKTFVYTNYCIMFLCAASNFASTLYIIFQCDPVAAAWDTDLLDQGGKCHDSIILQNIYFMDTSVNIFTDWATALMPIPLLWNIQMNLNTKISVGAILGLGIFASMSGCVRLAYTVNLTSSEDYLYGLANILIWGYAEPAIGMIVGNLATLRPLVRRMLQLDNSSGSGTSKFTPMGGRERAHPYRSFDTELGPIDGDRKNDIMSSIQIEGGTPTTKGRASLSSDGDSQKLILEGTYKNATANKRRSGSHGIVVSRRVDISHS